MDQKHCDQSLGEPLQEYSKLARLGHSAERLAELRPSVVHFLMELAEHWTIDVAGVEMAVTFHVQDVKGRE